MSKALQVVNEFVTPHAEKLQAFLESGKTVEEFTVAYPFEAGCIYAATSIATKLYCNVYY